MNEKEQIAKAQSELVSGKGHGVWCPEGATLTSRENLLKILNGEQPEWIPHYRDCVQWVIPSIDNHMAREDKKDFLGVTWMVNEAGLRVDHAKRPLEDINDWRSVVHLPDPDAIDWEALAKMDLAGVDPEKAISVMWGAPAGTFFIPLMNMLGFEDGLCAMLEEPEAVAEFFEELCQYYEKVIAYCGKYYKPTMMTMSDDFCSLNAPFISKTIYDELLHPYYKRCADAMKAQGVYMEIHVCGTCEMFVDDWVDMGFQIWQPAQNVNNLKAIKEKYGNQLVLVGAWDSQGPCGRPNAPEEIVRQSVHDSIDNYAQGGGYIFWDGDPVGNSPEMLQKVAWLTDETRKYGSVFYK